MTPRKPSNDFESRYFDLLDARFDALDKSIAHNTQATEEGFKSLNGRLRRVEGKVFPEKQETVQQLPPIWRDQQVIKLLTIVAVAIVVLLVIVAGLRGISLPKGIL